jgi:DNA-binding MurR/RpiR family transcriptional regulator
VSFLLNRIEKNLEKLSDAERKIGEYVMGHPELIPSMTTKELSVKSRVSSDFVNLSVYKALKYLN